MANEITGPTLQDLKDQLGVSYEQMSGALGARSIGAMVGAIMGGFINERFYRHSELILACSLWTIALATLAIPFMANVVVVAIMLLINGLGIGVLLSGKTYLIVN